MYNISINEGAISFPDGAIEASVAAVIARAEEDREEFAAHDRETEQRQQIVDGVLADFGLTRESFRTLFAHHDPATAELTAAHILQTIGYFAELCPDEGLPGFQDMMNESKRGFIVDLYQQLFNDEIIDTITCIADTVNPKLDPIQGISRTDAHIIDITNGITKSEAFNNRVNQLRREIITLVQARYHICDATLIFPVEMLELGSTLFETIDDDPEAMDDAIHSVAVALQKYYPAAGIMDLEDVVIDAIEQNRN